MTRRVLAALALTAAMLAAPAAAQNVTGRDPQAVRALFNRWGFAPGPLNRSGAVPVFDTTVDGIGAVVAFGGCTEGRNCTYLIINAVYSDVVNPPVEWINEQNKEFDLITASRNDAGLLSLRASIMLGGDGVPESTLRVAIGDWAMANGEIAERAIQAGLATRQP